MRSGVYVILSFAFFTFSSLAKGSSFSSNNVAFPDTNVTKVDTVKYDSTVGENFFNKKFVLKPYTHLNRPQFHPLFFMPSNLITHEVKIDSTGRFVKITEKIADSERTFPLVIPLEKYIQIKLEENKRKSWIELAHRYEKKEERDDIERLFGSITNIQIPVPANPIFSIFGPPVINLHISGAVDITGAWRNEKTEQLIVSRLGSVRNEPDFNQQVQINVGGTIGDKLNITADWNTQRQFEFENQLKIRYKGYDDEIIQSIEAGNVSLQTPSTLIGSSQALFGIKANLQLGPLKLTTIASQKKGESQERVLTGGAQTQSVEVFLYQYSQRHYFIDEKYIKTYEPYYQNSPPLRVAPELQVKDIEVWVSQLERPEPGLTRFVVADINLPPITNSSYYDSLRTKVLQSDPGRIEVGLFRKLEPGKDYTINADIGVISLNIDIQDNQALAVAYRIEGPTQIADDDTVYGDFVNSLTDTAVTLVLKLVRPKSPQPSFKKAWLLQLRNIYPLAGARNIKKEGFELKLLYKPSPDQEEREDIDGINLLKAFGFDRFTEDGSPGSDNKFDFSDQTINPSRGEIIFPFLKPFSKETLKKIFPDKGDEFINSIAYDDIYDTNQVAARNNTAKASKFKISAKLTSDAQATYNLGFNVAEGSVQVYLNDRRLVEGVDYRVDYILGQLTILNRDALLPGANLRIRYETNDLFSFASKTILGARGDLDLGENTKFGFTFMNYAQQTLSDKVRLGEEPISNTMLGIDLSTRFNSRRISEFFNIFPGYQAKQDAAFSLRGESAFIIADPNTRKSTIVGDNRESVVYLDDFEGSKRIISFSLISSHWHFSGAPAFMPLLGETRKEEIPDTIKVQRKGYLAWFNIPQSVQVTEVWPQKRVAQEEQFITPLDIQFFPQRRGQYNYTAKWDSIKNFPRQNWAGMMRVLPYFSTDLTTENITYIEIWFKVIGNPGPNAKMLINLGQISEDVIPNKRLDTEDKNGNYRLDPGEDVGFDGMSDDEERAKYPYFGNDPSQDNFDYADPLKRNGTEGNRNFYPEPDQEDLNRNHILDLVNNYFEYEIPLDTVNNPYIAGGGSNGWYQLKIPLSSFTRSVGNPSFTLIEFVRVWFTGFDNDAIIRIAEFNLVGNYWEELVKNDEMFKVTVVSVEDNPNYTPPPGVQRPRDRTRPDQQIEGNEQSLAFVIRNLPDDTLRFAMRRFPQRLDLFNYKIMRLFVHGDKNFYFRDTTDYSAEIFIWIGTDTSNYYEYRQPIWPDWDVRNNIQIVFDQLTALKQTRDSINQPVSRILVPDGPPGATYWVKGNPSLTNITFIAIGVTNPRGKGPALLSGDVWVNELRLLKANDALGWAYNLSAQFSVPELLNVSFGLARKSPEFRGLTDKFVNSSARILSTNWAFSTNFNIEKVLPSFLSSSLRIPFTYSRTENIGIPKYIPGKDILATEAANRLRQTIIEKGGTEEEANRKADSLLTVIQQIMVSETWAIPSVNFTINSQKWYVRDVINKINIGFNFNRSKFRDINTELSNKWGFNFQTNYSTSIKPITFKPFKSLFGGIPLLDAYKDWEIQLTPSSIAGMMRFDRGQENRKFRTKTAYEPTTRVFNAQRGFSFDWKFSNNGLINPSLRYQVDIGSNLVHLETDSLGRQRSTKEIFGDIFFKDGLINFGKTSTLSQQISIGTNPRIPPILGLNKYLSTNFSYSSAYRWQNNFQQRDLGRSAGYSANLNFNLSLKLKSLANSWFGEEEQVRRGVPAQKDTSKKSGFSLSPKDVLKILIKTPFLDYENVQVTFTQTNTAMNTGLYSERPGMGNLWSWLPFISDRIEYGPSLLYQLGFVSDPNGKIQFTPKKGFPFFGFEQSPGLRAPNGNLDNNYTQNNRISITTSRSLWQGAYLDLSWNLGWSYQRNQRIVTDSLGIPKVTSFTSSASVSRSFLTLPPVFIFSIFKSGIKSVASIYSELKLDPNDKRTDDEKLAQAFEEGFETLPFLSKLFGGFIPRLNWRLRWDGLEKFSIFKSFATRVSLEHAYTSNFEKRWRSFIGQGQTFEGERTGYDFNPLIGLNLTFKPLWNGNLTGGFRYITSTYYDLNFSAKAIVETFRREISFNLSYSKRGFNLPIFGLSLKNDVDITFTYSSSKNSRQTYQARNLSQALPLDGILRTTMELRFRYMLSTRVTGSLFYRLTKSKSDSRSTFIPGSTINEVGIDLHISIGT
ncbi:MAG: cell surface protein SprA [Candidatus Kryptonium sp.]